MKFDCKKISISDEEFGCTVTLSENENNGVLEKETTVEETMYSMGQYILLQRTYPEEEFESDYYYIETSDPDKSGELKNFSIDLYPTQLVMTYGNELFDIGLNTNSKKFENLKNALEKLINNRGHFTVHE